LPVMNAYHGTGRRVPVYKGSFWSLPTGINRGLEWIVSSVGALV
jgi:hypothetical protein